jgi:hypothetical protein
MVGNAVRMLLVRLQSHQIDDIDDPDLEVGNMVAQKVDGREGLHRRNVAGARHYDIGLAAAVVARPSARAQSVIAAER